MKKCYDFKINSKCFLLHKKEYLKNKNIPFSDIDVSQNITAAEEMIRKSGQSGVPVIDFNGQIVIGFDRSKLDKLIK